jgi:hypothetical protein
MIQALQSSAHHITNNVAETWTSVFQTKVSLPPKTFSIPVVAGSLKEFLKVNLCGEKTLWRKMI